MISLYKELEIVYSEHNIRGAYRASLPNLRTFIQKHDLQRWAIHDMPKGFLTYDFNKVIAHYEEGGFKSCPIDPEVAKYLGLDQEKVLKK